MRDWVSVPREEIPESETSNGLQELTVKRCLNSDRDNTVCSKLEMAPDK